MEARKRMHAWLLVCHLLSTSMGGGLCGWHARSYACFCVAADTLGSAFKGSDFMS